jgi:hypothetical protein
LLRSIKLVGMSIKLIVLRERVPTPRHSEFGGTMFLEISFL